MLRYRGKIASQFFHFTSMASPLQSLGSRLKAGLGTTLAATSSCALGLAFFSAPASASITGCQQGDASGQFVFSDITAGFTCYVGDKVYSDFANFSGMGANDTFSLFQGGPNNEVHSLSVQGGSNGGYFTPGTYGFNYKVTVWQGNQAIQTYSTGATTNVGGVVWEKDLISTGSPVSATATNLTPGGTSSSSTFNPLLTSADFTTSLNVTSGIGVTQWSDALIQTNNTSGTATAPAPLPLLGAAAAFGLSRRLRRRVRQAR